MDSEGFVQDSEGEYGKYLNPDLVGIEAIQDIPCLILLGEPGIGKTHEITTMSNLVAEQAPKTGELYLSVKLENYGSDERLCRKIFEGETIKQWIKGKERLNLFVDSLDECTLQIKNVAGIIGEQIATWPVERLRLRIACRTAVWPSTLETALQNKFGKEKTAVFELMGLRRKDIITAATIEELPRPEDFIEAIAHRGAGSLAVKPITLRMLINTYKTGSMPPTRWALYEKGIELLCEENNEGRREKQFPQTDAKQLIEVASRIAAITILGNRKAIWMDIDQGETTGDDITVSKMSGGIESCTGQTLNVTDSLLRETIGTGMFTSRGPQRMGWAHQTYAEFLAARYIQVHGLNIMQIECLLLDSIDRKVIPQLAETAAWLSEKNTEFRILLMEREPDLLFRSDLTIVEESFKAQLTETYLNLVEQQKTDKDWDFYHDFKKLRHSGLSQQLLPYIQDKHRHSTARAMAIAIAQKCQVKELIDNLWNVACDRHDGYHTRWVATTAVAQIGDANDKQKLKQFLLPNDDDPDDRLKGCALEALWPRGITAEELFAAIQPRRSTHHIGSYDLFLSQLIRDGLPGIDGINLIPALQWVVKGINGHDFKYRDLSDAIMRKGWDALLEFLQIVESYADAVITRLASHEGLVSDEKIDFHEIVKNDRERSRIVVQSMVQQWPEKKLATYYLFGLVPLVVVGDIPWIIQQYKDANHNAQKIWADLLGWLCRSDPHQYIEDIVGAMQQNPDIAGALSFLSPVTIASPEGRKMKAQYLRSQRFDQKMAAKRNRPILIPTPIERVLSLLDKFEAEDPNAWWQLNYEMTLEPNSTHYGSELESDLTELPVWKEAGEKIRDRIIEVAKRYILAPPALDTAWIGTNTIYRPAYAGYRALELLMKFNKGFVESLSPTIWTNWSPIVVCYPLNGEESSEPYITLIKLAYQNVPDCVLDAISKVIEKENRDHGHAFCLRRINGCFDDRMGAKLLDIVRVDGMKVEAICDLVHFLLEHEYRPTIEYVNQFISRREIKGADKRNLYIKISSIYVILRTFDAWRGIWKVILDDDVLGHEIVEEIAEHSEFRRGGIGGFCDCLSETEVADLYIWLEERYPYREDPKHDEVYSPGPRDNIADFRNSLLGYLEAKGTERACSELRRICRRFTNDEWRKRVVLRAEENRRRGMWNPPTPKHILDLAADTQRRYVESDQQLVEAICESLKRFERYLHNENQAIYDIWDNRGNATNVKYCPKDEKPFSLRVSRHLQEDLKQKCIVVNREVEIRLGQETDIHVDAISLNERTDGVKTISAIIEVKGCWHKELQKAMKTQLVDRYLKDNLCPNGIYLVGWFNCDKWDGQDYRKDTNPKMDLPAARDFFERQAKELMEKTGVLLKAYVLDAGLR